MAAGLLAAGILVVTGPAVAEASPTCSGTTSGCFSVNVASTSAVAGESATFDVTITNEAPASGGTQAGTEPGSGTVTAPSGFVITGASVQESSDPDSDGGTPSAMPNPSDTATATFANLDVEPGGSAMLVITADVPCSASGASPWSVSAFVQGSTTQLTFDSANSSVSPSVTGPCQLSFASPGAEPAGTTVGSTITSVFDSPTGAPVQVALLDGVGNPFQSTNTNASSPVTVSLYANPGSGTLSGTPTENGSTATSTASFDDLSTNAAAPGYELEATSPGFTPATSNPFTISQTIQACTTTPCSGSASATDTSASVNSSSSSSGDFLSLGFGGVGDPQCNGYTSTTTPLVWDVVDSQGGPISAETKVTLQVSRAAAIASGHRGWWTWQVCYQSTTPFTDRSGSQAPLVGSYYTGLLPNCNLLGVLFGKPVTPPCVLWRLPWFGGSVRVTFLATGDPRGRM